MSQCLRPIYIKIDRRDKILKSMSLKTDAVYQARTRYKDIRPTLIDLVPVPCGKCIECLKNRQNNMVARCNAEAEKRGTFGFLTLTYDDEHLPIAQSLWRVSKETGEIERLEDGEVICSARDSLFVDRARILDILPKEKGPKPVYYDRYIDGFEDEEFRYFFRLTPTVCRTDVRLWLKRSRVRYERKFGCKFSPFSYVAVSEYGPNTCRPHYHLAFFGLNKFELEWLAYQWKYGYTDYKFVNHVNPDGTNGFQIASKYLGKYMTKGKFDCESVCDKSAEKPRVCQSKGIGKSMLEKLRPQMCGFDMFGEYDLDTFFCPSLGRCLNENELNQLSNEIPKRLSYCVGPNLRLPIPRVIREAIFFRKKVERGTRKQYVFDEFGNSSTKEVQVSKVARVPTSLWLMVSYAIRAHFSADNTAKFIEYCSRYPEGQIFKACRDFAYYAESHSSLTELASEKNYIDFLSSSVF